MLKFEINGQTLKRVDTFGVVADSINYLEAEFDISNSDFGGIITAIFEPLFGGVAYEQVLVDNACVVPYEVIKASGFKVSLFCYIDEKRITTNPFTIRVAESGYKKGETPREPSPTEYEQLVEIANKTKEIAQLVRDDANEGKFNGRNGVDATIEIGTVSKGENASVVNTGTISHAVFDFVLPKGDKGAKGDKGEQGVQGIQGIQGETGSDGKSAYEIAVEHGYTESEEEWLKAMTAIVNIDEETIIIDDLESGFYRAKRDSKISYNGVLWKVNTEAGILKKGSVFFVNAEYKEIAEIGSIVIAFNGTGLGLPFLIIYCGEMEHDHFITSNNVSNTPTSGLRNPISSGAVYTALQAKQNKLTDEDKQAIADLANGYAENLVNTAIADVSTLIGEVAE